MLVFGELQLTKISLNFNNSGYKLKTGALRAMCGFSIVLILKAIMTFQSQRLHAFCRRKTLTLKL